LRRRGAVLACLFAVVLGCSRRTDTAFQGYVEGEFVHIAAPVAGRLERLHVERGRTVEEQAPLFDLESAEEEAAVRQAAEAMRASESRLADLRTGKRRPEIEVTQAQIEQARALADQSASALARDTAQFDAGGISRGDLETTRARHDVNLARVRELTGQLEVSRLAARPDQIQAQSAEVAANRAALDRASWRLAQKHVAATRAGLVFDTLFREGEWVPAGSPVVRMLPPANVKVRFFVGETETSRFQLGQALSIRCDGCAKELPATLTYVSTEPEYTPPIIYSNETRGKLVFMLEGRPDGEGATLLRPGQPVEVSPR
jgi:HlyD family secretion protein